MPMRRAKSMNRGPRSLYSDRAIFGLSLWRNHARRTSLVARRSTWWSARASRIIWLSDGRCRVFSDSEKATLEMVTWYSRSMGKVAIHPLRRNRVNGSLKTSGSAGGSVRARAWIATGSSPPLILAVAELRPSFGSAQLIFCLACQPERADETLYCVAETTSVATLARLSPI